MTNQRLSLGRRSAAGTFLAILTCVHLPLAHTVNLQAAQAPSGSAASQKLLDDTASLNENLVEFALDGTIAEMVETATRVEAAFPKLRGVVEARTLAAIEERGREQRAAVKAGDRTGTALASVELYRLLQEAMNPQTRVTPVQVSLLDYSGFKLLALTRAKAVEWRRVDAAANEAGAFWKQVQGRVGSTALRNLVDAIMTGLGESSAAREPAFTAFAAKMLLESVDLLEGQFTGK